VRQGVDAAAARLKVPMSAKMADLQAVRREAGAQ
jgi:hypothetical protein